MQRSRRELKEKPRAQSSQSGENGWRCKSELHRLSWGTNMLAYFATLDLKGQLLLAIVFSHWIGSPFSKIIRCCLLLGNWYSHTSDDIRTPPITCTGHVTHRKMYMPVSPCLIGQSFISKRNGIANWLRTLRCQRLICLPAAHHTAYSFTPLVLHNMTATPHYKTRLKTVIGSYITYKVSKF